MKVKKKYEFYFYGVYYLVVQGENGTYFKTFDYTPNEDEAIEVLRTGNKWSSFNECIKQANEFLKD
ncbi:MAG: hypothetical protein U9Q33_13490 [Campylobacterota bacterium]|nr:hypothetical protein [Campylobacterota bacterium]